MLKIVDELFCNFRSFKLRLKRDTSIFDPNLDVEQPFDPNKMYKGHVEGKVLFKMISGVHCMS